jgi:hypothetical protein
MALAEDDPSDEMNELVPVYVPRRRLYEVYRLLGETSELTAAPTADMVDGLPYREWTEAENIALIATGTKMARSIAALMDSLVEEPDEWFSFTSVMERTGLDIDKLRGALSALTRHVRARYDRYNGPFMCKRGVELGDGFEALYYYSVTASAAEAWERARQRAS